MCVSLVILPSGFRLSYSPVYFVYCLSIVSHIWFDVSKLRNSWAKRKNERTNKKKNNEEGIHRLQYDVPVNAMHNLWYFRISQWIKWRESSKTHKIAMMLRKKKKKDRNMTTTRRSNNNTRHNGEHNGSTLCCVRAMT